MYYLLLKHHTHNSKHKIYRQVDIKEKWTARLPLINLIISSKKWCDYQARDETNPHTPPLKSDGVRAAELIR